MGDGFIGQQCHGIGNGNAVVAAQGGTLGKDILTVVVDIQTLGCHVDGAVGILLADHVHMALDDHRLVVFVAGGGIAEEQYIVQIILDIAQVIFLGKVHQVVGNSLGIVRAMGNGTNLFKIAKHSLRLQSCQFSRIHMHTPPFICIILTQGKKNVNV